MAKEFRIYFINRLKNLKNNIQMDGRYRLAIVIVSFLLIFGIIVKNIGFSVTPTAVVDNPSIPNNVIEYKFPPEELLPEDNNEEVVDIYKYENYKIHESKLVPDHAEYGINIMIENNIHPSLLLAIIDAKSNGDIFATTENSSAKGYGQINENTSRWIYEDIIGKYSYTHSMHNDPYIDIEIMSAYIVHLIDVYNGNIESVIYAYNDGIDEEFYDDIEIYLLSSNTSIEEIEKIYNGGNIHDALRK